MDFTRDMGKVLQYCPKCGAGAQWVEPKLLACRGCGFELYLNAATAAAALIADKQGRLLVIERAREPKKGAWDLPGGFTDPGESAEESLRREVKEELDLEIVSMRYLCSYPNTYEYMGLCYATVDLGFICQVADAAAVRACPSEVAEFHSVPLEELDPARFGFDSIKKIVQRYLAVRRMP